jgi:hypothetical protein
MTNSNDLTVVMVSLMLYLLFCMPSDWRNGIMKKEKGKMAGGIFSGGYLCLDEGYICNGYCDFSWSFGNQKGDAHEITLTMKEVHMRDYILELRSQ